MRVTLRAYMRPDQCGKISTEAPRDHGRRLLVGNHYAPFTLKLCPFYPTRGIYRHIRGRTMVNRPTWFSCTNAEVTASPCGRTGARRPLAGY